MRCPSWGVLAFLGVAVSNSAAPMTAAITEDHDAPEKLSRTPLQPHKKDSHERQACLLQVARSNATKPSPGKQSKKPLVEIFYETKCPYSIDFLNTTLREAWQDAELWKAMDVKLYPFGNAGFYAEKMISKGYHFWHPGASYPLVICQHGEAECLGNRIHACAIDVLQESRKYVPFIICMAGYGTNAGAELSSYECGEQLGISMDKIKDCVDTKKGLDLMESMASTTRSAKVAHVPWVMVNGEHTHNDTLLSPVCGVLEGAKPRACRTEKNEKKSGGGSGPCLLRTDAHSKVSSAGEAERL